MTTAAELVMWMICGCMSIEALVDDATSTSTSVSVNVS